jgi:hypothetical protein
MFSPEANHLPAIEHLSSRYGGSDMIPFVGIRGFFPRQWCDTRLTRRRCLPRPTKRSPLDWPRSTPPRVDYGAQRGREFLDFHRPPS